MQRTQIVRQANHDSLSGNPGNIILLWSCRRVQRLLVNWLKKRFV